MCVHVCGHGLLPLLAHSSHSLSLTLTLHQQLLPSVLCHPLEDQIHFETALNALQAKNVCVLVCVCVCIHVCGLLPLPPSHSSHPLSLTLTHEVHVNVQ